MGGTKAKGVTRKPGGTFLRSPDETGLHPIMHSIVRTGDSLWLKEKSQDKRPNRLGDPVNWQGDKLNESHPGEQMQGPNVRSNFRNCEESSHAPLLKLLNAYYS